MMESERSRREESDSWAKPKHRDLRTKHRSPLENSILATAILHLLRDEPETP